MKEKIKLKDKRKGIRGKIREGRRRGKTGRRGKCDNQGCRGKKNSMKKQRRKRMKD